MVGRVFLFALLVFVAFGEEEWCGADSTGDFGLAVTRWYLKTGCGEHYRLINTCCRGHDLCYSKKRGRSTCDYNFFTCMRVVARDCPYTFEVIRSAVDLAGHANYPARFSPKRSSKILNKSVEDGNLL
ncbi:unnamed protein product [Bursaphelenchus xylophilus]|uniref:(pine wood nematode) hypothetical protein n=1 Tax=Bursaphelenchus xylophilus TaxID=6326 RepID=A0A1I7RZN7_BURXY|nr:unnamed protein product [Bursaphelenchus xylophilus]CAG9111475.1 unnamed protein product [Bursaphelenchus xylophilus]